MKRLSVAFLVILLACSLLVGCCTKEKIEQKVGEKLAEEAVEKILGDENAEVDIDGEKITVKGKEGETLSLGGAEWPDIDYIPEFKQGRIISAAHDSNSAMIILEEVDRKNFKDYLEDIKKVFTEENYEMQAEEYLLFEGKNTKGEKIVLQYFTNDNSLTIIGGRESE
ncbi:MAG TPA: hypothetical protein GXZ70_05365 [Clostridiales bacterium]|nr:hypothetical protein [Clostridiales bacterium]